MSDFEIREIVFASSEYDDYTALRDRILRQPLGLEFSEVDLDKEQTYRHFGLFEGENIFATVMIVPYTDDSCQVRQMAVDFDRQGKSVGRILLTAVEKQLYSDGIKQVFLHSRDVAIGFYERLGYIPVGERFLEVGLPHQKMEKRLK
ncbi:MAG: GNAT family N-acetyltransferase [Akkermansiaceae bacterium]